MHIGDEVKLGDEIEAKVKRGPESWTFFYLVLGIVLAIEIAAVSMTPLRFPLSFFVLLALAGLTVLTFIESEWLHNKLVGLKLRYESKAR